MARTLRIFVGPCLAAIVLTVAVPATSFAAGDALGAPGQGSSWTTGNKLAIGTSSGTTSKVWFTVANGISTEVFYPRADIPNVQDLQYVISDGSSFVDLE